MIVASRTILNHPAQQRCGRPNDLDSEIEHVQVPPIESLGPGLNDGHHFSGGGDNDTPGRIEVDHTLLRQGDPVELEEILKVLWSRAGVGREEFLWQGKGAAHWCEKIFGRRRQHECRWRWPVLYGMCRNEDALADAIFPQGRVTLRGPQGDEAGLAGQEGDGGRGFGRLELRRGHFKRPAGGGVDEGVLAGSLPQTGKLRAEEQVDGFIVSAQNGVDSMPKPRSRVASMTPRRPLGPTERSPV